MLVAIVATLGCRGSAGPGPGGGPAGAGAAGGSAGSGSVGSSAGGGPAVSTDVAALVALADQACACADPPCRDRIRERWRATPTAPARGADPARMDLKEVADEVGHDAAYHAAYTRLLGCLQPDHSAAVVIARVKAFSDRACACARADTACLDTAKAELDRFLEVAWPQQAGYTRADKTALAAQLREFERCHEVGPP